MPHRVFARGLERFHESASKCSAGALADATADSDSDSDPEVHRVLTEKVFPHQSDVIGADDLWMLSGRKPLV
jgi:hypothetical protein